MLKYEWGQYRKIDYLGYYCDILIVWYIASEGYLVGPENMEKARLTTLNDGVTKRQIIMPHYG